MASFDDDADGGGGSNDEFENEDEEMEDVNEADQDQDQDQGQDDEGGEDDEDEDNEDNEGDNDEDEDEDPNDPDSPSRRPSAAQRASSLAAQRKPMVIRTSPSPRRSTVRSPSAAAPASFIPPVRPEALVARSYDIVPTMAAPQSTSINALAATPDMQWVFSGGLDGYVRMYNWVETANGKVPLTVAQKHPFVDSVWKAGSLLTYWENEEPAIRNEDTLLRTPPKNADEGKWLSPVYSLAVQHHALWLLSGLESGGINLQTCRHQAGTKITTLRGHSSAVSVLNLSQDETNLLSGSWDKMIHDWDLQTGRIKRSFEGSGGQISAIETRPLSDLAVPEVLEPLHDPFATFSSNNANKSLSNGILPNGTGRRESRTGDEDALGSPSGSLFGEGDHGSLFGEDTAPVGGGGNAFGDDEDELAKALEDGLQESNDAEQDAAAEPDTEMMEMGDGGPLQAPEPSAVETNAAAEEPEQPDKPDPQPEEQQEESQQPTSSEITSDITMNGLPNSDEPLTAPPTDESSSKTASATDLPPQSESTFLSAAFDGSLHVWDRRVSSPIAYLPPYGATPPWCTGACWSPDGNFIYAGRRNCAVDEYSIHKLGSNKSKPERTFKFQQGSGPVYALKAMPNGRHLVCASQDILRIYDLAQSETSRHRTVPFTIIPGHRGGVISTVYVDPSCRFMLSAAGNRGWEGGAGTEVLLGYEIGFGPA